MAAVIYCTGQPAPTGSGPGTTSIIGGDRALCRVLEFAEEFGISVSYDPLMLCERRGGY